MHSGMTVGEIINALRGYPEHYVALVGRQEVAGVHKATVVEECKGGAAVVLELQAELPLGEVEKPREEKPKPRKPRD